MLSIKIVLFHSRLIFSASITKITAPKSEKLVEPSIHELETQQMDKAPRV